MLAEVVVYHREEDGELAPAVASKRIQASLENRGGLFILSKGSKRAPETQEGTAQILSGQSKLYCLLIVWNGFGFPFEHIQGPTQLIVEQGLIRVGFEQVAQNSLGRFGIAIRAVSNGLV
jgi:hypothetical protein